MSDAITDTLCELVMVLRDNDGLTVDELALHTFCEPPQIDGALKSQPVQLLELREDAIGVPCVFLTDIANDTLNRCAYYIQHAPTAIRGLIAGASGKPRPSDTSPVPQENGSA